MGIGEAGAVAGDKPQTHADRSPFAGSANAFTDALDRSAGPSSSTQAEQLAPSGRDLNQARGGENVETLKVGARNEHFAPIETETKASADADFTSLEAAWKGRHLQVPSFAQSSEQAPTNGLYPPDAFAGPGWSRVREFAPFSQNAICEGIGLSAAPGTGSAPLAAGGDALALPIVLEGGTGFSSAGLLGPFAEFGPGPSFGMNLINRHMAAIVARANPVSIVSAAAIDTFGGQVVNLIGEDLKPTAEQRMTDRVLDVFEGAIIIPGVGEFVTVPELEEAFGPRQTPADPTADDTFASTWQQWSASLTDIDDLAADAEKATATTGWDAASTIEDETAEIAAYDAANPSRTARGDDAGDAIRMRQQGTGDGYRPSGPSSVWGSETDEPAADIPDRSDTFNVRYAAGADAPKVASNANIAAGAAAVAGIPAPTTSVDQIINAYVTGRPPAGVRNSMTEGDVAPMKERLKGELRRNGHDPEIADQISEDQYLLMAVAEGIYSHSYQPAVAEAQPTLTAAQLNDQRKQHEGPTERPDLWSVRPNRFSPDTPLDHSRMNASPAYVVDPASGGAGGDSSGSGEDQQRRDRRPAGRQAGSRKSL